MLYFTGSQGRSRPLQADEQDQARLDQEVQDLRTRLPPHGEHQLLPGNCHDCIGPKSCPRSPSQFPKTKFPTRGPGGKITTFIGEKSPIKVVMVYLIVTFCTQFTAFNRLYRGSKRGPPKKVVIFYSARVSLSPPPFPSSPQEEI